MKTRKDILIVTSEAFTGDIFSLSCSLIMDPTVNVLIIQSAQFEAIPHSNEENILIEHPINKMTLSDQEAELFEVTAGDYMVTTSQQSKNMANFFKGMLQSEEKDLDNKNRVFVVPAPTKTYMLYSGLTRKKSVLGYKQYVAQHARNFDGDGILPKQLVENIKPVLWAPRSFSNIAPAKLHKQVHSAWSLPLPEQSRQILQNLFDQLIVKKFHPEKYAAGNKPVLVLWFRFSGKKGCAYGEFDTSYVGNKQLIDLAHSQGFSVILAGDLGYTKEKGLKHQSVAADAENVIMDLREMWTDELFKEIETNFPHLNSRLVQFNFFEYLNARFKLEHVGLRSGNLEGLAYMGQSVHYLQYKELKKGQQRAQNLEKFGFHPIKINTPPTRVGKFDFWSQQLSKQEFHELNPLRPNNMLARHLYLADSAADRREKKQRFFAIAESKGQQFSKGFSGEDLEIIADAFKEIGGKSQLSEGNKSGIAAKKQLSIKNS